MWAKRNDSRIQRTAGDERPNYLKYGDVFMTAQRKPINCVRKQKMDKTGQCRQNDETHFRFASPTFQPEIDSINNHFSTAGGGQFVERRFEIPKNVRQETLRNDDAEYEEYENQEEFSRPRNTDFSRVRLNRFRPEEEIPDYVVPQARQNVRLQRRQLPQLQWYQDTRNDSDWDEFCEYDLPRKKSKYSLSFPAIWQKFVITFTSLLSLICITWIAYNWKSPNTTNGLSVIKPEKPFFKVLPDTPGGAEIPYQDKVIYNRLDPSININQHEHLMSQTEEPGELPVSNEINLDNNVSNRQVPQMQDYTIIDDRDYYIKCTKASDTGIVQNKVASIRANLSRYENQRALEGISCSVRKVSNIQGQVGEYILIGPFRDSYTAGDVGKFCRLQGEIITVKKKTN